MKKTLQLIILIAIFVNYSCDEYVDIEPKGNAIATSLDDINQLLNNTTLLSAELGNAIPTLVNDNIKATDNELNVVGNTRDSDFIENIYRLEPVFYSGIQSDESWKKHYITIGYAN